MTERMSFRLSAIQKQLLVKEAKSSGDSNGGFLRSLIDDYKGKPKPGNKSGRNTRRSPSRKPKPPAPVNRDRDLPTEMVMD